MAKASRTRVGERVRLIVVLIWDCRPPVPLRRQLVGHLPARAVYRAMRLGRRRPGRGRYGAQQRHRCAGRVRGCLGGPRLGRARRRRLPWGRPHAIATEGAATAPGGPRADEVPVAPCLRAKPGLATSSWAGCRRARSHRSRGREWGAVGRHRAPAREGGVTGVTLESLSHLSCGGRNSRLKNQDPAAMDPPNVGRPGRVCRKPHPVVGGRTGPVGDPATAPEPGRPGQGCRAEKDNPAP